MLHLDTGNTAFMLLCASLVMLMTPGLAFFYGGLVGRKNVLAIMMQSFVSMGWTTVFWWAFGFSLCFSGDQKTGTDFFGIIGNLNWAGLRGITLSTPSPNDTIPMLVFCAYQMMFAIITPALITGAFANRITFKAYMLFLTGWLIFVYFPFVHMVWGGGMLAQWGVMDFAGGIVVHNIAGIAALASVLYVGKRKVVGPRSAQHPAGRARHRACSGSVGTASMPAPNSVSIRPRRWRFSTPTSPLRSRPSPGCWWIGRVSKKPKFLGLLTGAVAGLATITPAAGYVSPATAVIIGTVAGVVCFYAVRAEEPAAAGTTLSMCGACTALAAFSESFCSASLPRRRGIQRPTAV